MKSISDQLVDVILAIILASMIVAILTILVAIALVIVGIGLFVRWGIHRYRAKAMEGPKLGLFGAPASNWWVETYERCLGKLEELTSVNFTSSPERLFAGSLFLAGLTGVPLTTLPIPTWVPFLVVVANGLSAWTLSKPAASWWQPLPPEPEQSEWGLGGFVIGEPLDEFHSED